MLNISNKSRCNELYMMLRTSFQIFGHKPIKNVYGNKKFCLILFHQIKTPKDLKIQSVLSNDIIRTL